MCDVEVILKIMTSRRYSRDGPENQNKIRKLIEDAILKGKPIKLVGFWGVGEKLSANSSERETLEFFNSLNNGIKEIYEKGLEFTFVLADSHGFFNGIDENVIKNYCKSVIKLFEKFNYRYIFLSDLWKKWDLNMKKIDLELRSQPKDWWENINNSKLLEERSKNHYLNDDYKLGAKKYFIMRKLENRHIIREFSNSIFHTFSDSKFKNLLPKMPIVYLYSRKGWSDCPWFMK